jgi:putative heme iron utilization protein
MGGNAANVLRELTPEVLSEARALVRGAQSAALAVLEPETGHPLVSRVGLATLADGTPLIILSRLAAHSSALDADKRCSLLIGEPGKGEPLAHARIMLVCRARPIPPGGQEAEEARERYLAVHPRAAIYVDLPDFRFFALDVERARFNAGFGRAYAIAGEQLLG